MVNRFRLGVRVVDWTGVRRWLDVGCGTGRFFAEAEATGRRFDRLTGVDITPAMIALARQQALTSPASFERADLATLDRRIASSGGFDLVTAVGLLQRCGHGPDRVLTMLADAARKGAQIFLTTKHLGWSAFVDQAMEPEATHSWFDLEELLAIVRRAGFRVERCGGFLPREERIVEPPQSHTVFVVGRRL